MKTSQLDFYPGVTRRRENGRDIAHFYKKVCYRCRKPFNRKRPKREPITLIYQSGVEIEAHICSGCLKKTGPSGKYRGTSV